MAEIENSLCNLHVQEKIYTADIENFLHSSKQCAYEPLTQSVSHMRKLANNYALYFCKWQSFAVLCLINFFSLGAGPSILKIRYFSEEKKTSLIQKYSYLDQSINLVKKYSALKNSIWKEIHDISFIKFWLKSVRIYKTISNSLLYVYSVQFLVAYLTRGMHL